MSLARLTATLGDTSLDGALTIETKGVRPHLSGNLHLSELDLGRVLIRSGPPAAPSDRRRTASGPDRRHPAARTARPAKAPQVRGFTKRAGGGLDWSDERIDFSPLGLADADLALSVDRLVYKDVKTGREPPGARRSRIAWRRSTLEDVQLYGGRGRAAR